MNSDELLKKAAYHGLSKWTSHKNDTVYIDRLEYELSVIKKCGLSDFLLTTSYIVLSLKKRGYLVGPGRGSVGGSLVAGVIGIHELDPIKEGLSFERFINEDRLMVSLADIDIDIPKKDRPDIIKWMKKEFGEDKTYQIVNNVYFKDKNTLKDLCRIFGVSAEIANRLTAPMSDDDSIYDHPHIMEFLEDYPQILQLFPHIKGLIRSMSVHAGGILISDKPMTDYISTLKTEGAIVTCYNGTTCDKNGFLKQDMLGLNTLSIISDCLKLIGKDKFDFDCDMDDPNVYDTINKSVLGIFQLEGKGAAEYTYKMKPRCFDDLVAALALVRPGSKDSGDSDEFLRVRFGEKDIEYDHPLLEPILKDTNGCILYQEQAMEISRVLSGFTGVEADTLRKGIGKKLDYIFTEYKPKFINGAVQNGVDEDVAELIWNKIEKSSSYSFNKSHSVAYALISYRTAYLKTYYPIEFYLSMLDNIDKGKDADDKRIQIYKEIREIDKEIINPDVNLSKEVTVSDDDKVYLSLGLIKEVGEKAVPKIIAGQPYTSFDDFKERAGVDRRVQKAMIQAGCFDSLGENRNELYNKVSGDTSIWTKKEELYREFQYIKINPQGNVLELYDLDELGIVKPISSINEITQNTDEYKDFYIKGIVSKFKKHDNYAHVAITDGFSSIGLFVVKEFIDRYIDELNDVGSCLLIHVHGKGEKYSLLSCINLEEPEKRKHEWDFYTGKSKSNLLDLQMQHEEINVGLVSNVRPFTSKKGNRCRWYDVYVNDNIVLENRIVCNTDMPIIDGSYLFFYVGDNETFLDIRRVG